jgi:hypothetical protein
LECILFLARRFIGEASKNITDGNQSPISLIQTEFRRIGGELAGGRLKVDLREAGKAIARTFLGLEHMQHGEFLHESDATIIFTSNGSSGVFDIAWDALLGEIRHPVIIEDNEAPPLIALPLIQAFVENLPQDSRPIAACREEILRVATTVATDFSSESQVKSRPNLAGDLKLLDQLMELFGDVVFANPEVASVRFVPNEQLPMN